MRPASAALLVLVLATCGTRRQLDETINVYSWTASIRSVEARTERAVPIRRARLTGRANLQTSRSDSMRTRAVVSLSSEGHARMVLRWAVLPGRCGASSFPLLPFDQYPPIEMAGSGTGQADVELPVRLEPGASYYINIYAARERLAERMLTQPGSILACGDLR